MERNRTWSTRQLLARYALLINRYGADSTQSAEFVDEHRYDQEFVELADLCAKVKKALTAPRIYPGRRRETQVN